MMAPASQPAGMPMNVPAPKSATPIVPTVVQELPASSDTTAHNRKVSTMKIFGWMNFRPYQIIVGTIPDSIHVAVNAPIDSRMMMAEEVDFRLSPTFSSKTLQGTLSAKRPISIVNTAAPKMAICEGPEVSSSPKILTPTTSRAIRKTIGPNSISPLIMGTWM